MFIQFILEVDYRRVQFELFYFGGTKLQINHIWWHANKNVEYQWSRSVALNFYGTAAQ
jgi:hypothetical protein